MAGELLGRGGETARFDRALARAAGSAQVVTVAADPGLGKTRLLRAFAARARRRHHLVLAGTATEFDRLQPFAAYTETMAALRVLGGAERSELYRAVRAALNARPGTVLLLDDLHWADDASLELTEYLLRRPVPSLMVLAYRRTAAPPGIEAAAAGLGDAWTVLTPGPLSEVDTARLVPASPARGRLLYQVSGGNPFYAKALADATDATLTALVADATLTALTADATLTAQPVDGTPSIAPSDDALIGPTDGAAPVGSVNHVAPRGPAAMAVPPGRAGLSAILQAELAGLPAPARTVAHAAAIAGDPASIDLIAAVAGLTPAAQTARTDATAPIDAADAIDGLVRLGILIETGNQFGFRYPVVRAAAYWTAAPAWRVAAHRRAAAHLRARNGPLGLLAHHTERYATDGDEEAARTLAEAGRACLDTDPTVAVRLLGRAARLLPSRPDLVEKRAGLLIDLARGLGATGDPDRSRGLLHEVMALPVAVRGDAVAYSSVVARLRGDLDEARALLTHQGGDAAQVLAELAVIEVLRGNPVPAQRHAAEVIRLAGGGADPALEAAGCALTALAALQRGDLDEARRQARRAGWLTDGVPDGVLLRHVELAAPLAWVEVHLGRYADADRHLSRALSLVDGGSRGYARPYLLIASAWRHLRLGDLTAALAAAAAGAGAARRDRSAEAATMADAMALLPTLWRDGPEAAVALADRLTSAGLAHSAWWSQLTRSMLVHVYLAAGRTREAVELLTSTMDELTADIAVAWWALGSVVDPAQADRAVALARTDFERGTALCARARVQDSEVDVSEAVAAHHQARSTIEEGLARQLRAEIRARRGDAAGMRADLGRARELFAPAPWLTRQLARTRTRLSAGLPGRTDGSALTHREREVAGLVAAGLTNREVAARLHLSQKTVEAHLRRIFTKLDVASRVALATHLARQQ